MNPTMESILKGCKFFLGPGKERWDSDLTRRALERMMFLCQLAISELDDPDDLPDTDEPEATPELAEKMFKQEQDEI